MSVASDEAWGSSREPKRLSTGESVAEGESGEIFSTKTSSGGGSGFRGSVIAGSSTQSSEGLSGGGGVRVNSGGGSNDC